MFVLRLWCKTIDYEALEVVGRYTLSSKKLNFKQPKCGSICHIYDVQEKCTIQLIWMALTSVDYPNQTLKIFLMFYYSMIVLLF